MRYAREVGEEVRTDCTHDGYICQVGVEDWSVEVSRGSVRRSEGHDTHNPP
jgi:hypothetical protein